jgi:branched-chain amino acid transport system substrate-binding protein
MRLLRWRRLVAIVVGLSGTLGLGLVGSASSATVASVQRPHSTALCSKGGTITVGEDEGITGAFGFLGIDDELGEPAYFHMINAAGGLDGCQLKIVSDNDQSVPSLAATLIRKLVQQQHAQFILGPEETSTAAAVVPVADELKVVDIVSASGWNYPGLTKAQDTSFAFPGIEDVFAEDDIQAVLQLVVPRHYTRVALIEDSTPGGLENKAVMQGLASKYHFTLTGTQIFSPGATDVTPQVLNLLAGKPQLIIFGLVPGADSEVAIKAIRAQSATLPIATCSACTVPSFITAVGGPSAMADVYSNASGPQQLILGIKHDAGNQVVFNDEASYIKEMKAVGEGTPSDLSGGAPGWEEAEELVSAIKAADSLDATKVMNALAHSKIQTLGLFWNRTPSNYTGLIRVEEPLVVVNKSGSLTVLPLPASEQP